jgi:hypothetical protein
VTTVFGTLCGALAAAGFAGLVVPPTRRLAPRLRPYTLVARARLGHSTDVLAVPPSVPMVGGAFGRIFGPLITAFVSRASHVVERRSDDALRTALLHAGLFDVMPDDYRARVAVQTLVFGGAGVALGLLVLHSTAFTLALGTCGAIFGASRARGRVDRAIADRRERIRLELYTVNQLLAMHVRTGAGPIQATQRVVDRGRGAVVEELAGVLRLVRSGTSEPEAFRRAAVSTPEPSAARTYKLFAAGAERGVDLAGGLRALSEDLRDARRDDLRKNATKRRAAMLVPTIAVLAPVMLLFIAAPLPSIVFGGR